MQAARRAARFEAKAGARRVVACGGRQGQSRRGRGRSASFVSTAGLLLLVDRRTQRMGCSFSSRGEAPQAEVDVQKYAIEQISSVSLFSRLSADDDVSLEVKETEFEMGETIFTQGEEIRTFGKGWIYVIKKGRCDIIDNDAGKVNEAGPGDILGERALLQNLPYRTATVKCSDPDGCRVIGISIRSLEKALGLEHELVLKEASDTTAILDPEEILTRLRAFPILQSLQDYLLVDVASKITVKRHNPGDYVLRKDDAGEEFYLLDRGRIGILRDEPTPSSPSSPGDLEKIQLTEEDDETNLIEADQSHELYRAFKGRFTSSPTALRSNGVASAILSYAASSKPKEVAAASSSRNGPSPFKELRARTVKTLAAGMFFGEGALLGDGRRGASVVALTHVTLLVMDKAAFTHLMKMLECPPSPEKRS